MPGTHAYMHVVTVKFETFLACVSLGQHEQKKYLSDANNHSTDKDTLLWNQLHALGLVLIHYLFLAVLLVTPP